MDLSGCANGSPTTSPLDSKFSNWLMRSFDVKNGCDEEYLAEVVISKIGNTEDIQSFVHLSLLRSMEAWDQAIFCACAMRDWEYCHNSLDGQDVLAFLSKLCGVNGPYHANTSLYPPRRSKRLRTKRASEREKQRKAKWKGDSPYWSETHVPAIQHDGRSTEDIQSDITAKPPPRKRRKLLEEDIQPIAVLSEEYDTATRACKGGAHKAGDDGDDDGTREALSELPTTQVSDVTDTTFEFTTDGEQATEKVQDLEEESENLENPPKLRYDQTLARKVAKSPYFEGPNLAGTPTKALSSKSPKKRPPRGTVSSLPFPRLDAPRFGLIQEELATDPFRLLIAVTFLVRTSGKAAIPVFRELMEEYPTPPALANAPAANIEAKIKHLGLGQVRAATIQRFARLWMENPPRKGLRYAVKNYQGHCADYVKEEDDGGEDEKEIQEATTSKWEIGHITQGPYALDSWRIFCRDVLRGEAEDWNGGGREGEFQPEWMRVLPKDKELRACLRWMWMQEGFQWDPDTGDKVILSEELRRAVQEGRIGYECDTGDLRILDK